MGVNTGEDSLAFMWKMLKGYVNIMVINNMENVRQLLFNICQLGYKKNFKNGVFFLNFSVFNSRLKFHDIHSFQSGFFMFSLKNSTLPSKFNNLFPINGQIHNYNTRNSHSFRLPHEWMTEWMNGRTNERTNEWMDGCMHACMHAWMNEWMRACMHACMHEWMNEWMNE